MEGNILKFLKIKVFVLIYKMLACLLTKGRLKSGMKFVRVLI